ncbi:MAG: hypothetical protein FWH22_10590 [Fibromonadales bacterium]|nr:hypothetical protein [Fibromonadales bacterium]
MKLAIIAFFLISCSPNFTNSHKLYKGIPAKNENIGYVELGDAFMLTRADWFSKKLDMQNDSIYSKLETLTDSIVFSEIQKTWTPSIVQKKEKENFSRETLKMDKTVFIKTRFPQQGIEISDSKGNVPDYLFIIHEYTIGGDLDAQNFYDYTKANLEMEQKRNFKKLSIIATFTLWDNKKQIPLRSGIVNTQIPVKEDSFNIDVFIKATKQVIAECLKKL